MSLAGRVEVDVGIRGGDVSIFACNLVRVWRLPLVMWHCRLDLLQLQDDKRVNNMMRYLSSTSVCIHVDGPIILLPRVRYVCDVQRCSNAHSLTESFALHQK